MKAYFAKGGMLRGTEAGTFEECCFCFLKDQGIKAPESAALCFQADQKKKAYPKSFLQ